MKKNRNSNKKMKRKKPATATAPVVTRRSFLKSIPYVVGGGVVLSGIGYLGVSAVRADLAEQDLDIVGSGKPVIVQIHNPSCPICVALQKETRAALNMLEGEELAYRVASITSTTGSDFANRHGATHATLLFFDSSGQIRQRVHGETDREILYLEFMAHIAASR